MHVWLVIVGTHYHNLNANNKKQVYWLVTSNVGIKMQKGTKLQHRTPPPKKNTHTHTRLLDFKLSPRSENCMLSSG